MKKTVCELFAGVGGFRVGLEAAGKWDFVWSNQWEPGKTVQYAFDCYCKHFGNNPNHINMDIASVDKYSIPNHNLLVGGFPCQDYSVARTGAQGISGKKGVLWWQIRDVLIAKAPPFVLLENVDRLLKSPAKQKGRDFGIMLSCFNDLGYSVEWRVINAAEYGFAQRRRRVFIFAFKNSTKFHSNLFIDNLGNWIHSNGFFQNEFPVEDICGKFTETYMEYDNILEISDTFHLDFKNSGIMSNGKIYTEETAPIYKEPIKLRDILEHNVSEDYFLKGNFEKWKVLKGSKRIERVTREGFKYIFSEGNMEFPDPLTRPARTMLTSESSLNRSTHVIEDPNTGDLRLLTPVETERINGFPDNWTNTGMPTKFRYFCMGNALVVGLIKKMGRTLNQILETEE